MKKKNIIIVAIITFVILLIPLVAMQFTDQVKWTFIDFIYMGMLIFGAGVIFEWISSRGRNTLYRIAVSVAVVTSLLVTWANLAVGIIGGEDNPANLMYFSIIPIGIAGALIVRFRTDGMSLVAFVIAVILMLIPLAALTIGDSDFEPGVAQVFALNAFFAFLFIVSGLLFRRSGSTGSKKEYSELQRAGNNK